MRKKIAPVIAAVAFAAAAFPARFSRAADWPLFRGPGRDGISADAGTPQVWGGEKNVKWKAPLPNPGNGSPVVSGGRVFVTCAEDPKGHGRSLYCFNRDDGKMLWVKTVTYNPVEPTHPTNPYCASTPAADGGRVVVWHGSAGLFCYDYDGKELWSRDLGPLRQIWGYASSPVFCGGRVILNCGPGAKSFVAAVDRKTGEVLWKTDEPGGADDKSAETGSWIGSWSTPLVVKVGGRDEVLVAQPRHVNAYDPETGKILWACAGTGDLAYADVMVGKAAGGLATGGDDLLAVAVGGYGGAAVGFKLPGPEQTGDVTDKNRLWRVTEKNPQRIGSGVLIGGRLFMANEPGFLQCLDAATGKERWRQRMADQHFWGSLVAAPGAPGSPDRLYATSQKGTTYVFAADPDRFALLQTNELGEATNSTPAASDGQLFFRTAGHLWCVEEK